jgi:hypothetical protein
MNYRPGGKHTRGQFRAPPSADAVTLGPYQQPAAAKL